jgi:hypothetical protein
MKRNWKIVSLTGIILLVVILLAINLYIMGKKEVLSQFREPQYVHGQQLAIQIQSYFLYHSWRLQEISPSIFRRYDDIKNKKADIHDYLESFCKQMEKAHVKGILLQDEFGAIINSASSNI